MTLTRSIPFYKKDEVLVYSFWNVVSLQFFSNFRETSTATKKDGYTQVPRPSVFIHGLRGCGAIGSAPNATNVVNNQANWTTLYRETAATTVDLTISVEQQLLGNLQKVTVGHNVWL